MHLVSPLYVRDPGRVYHDVALGLRSGIGPR